MHEELRRDDVELLTDVLAHAHHRAATVGRGAGGVLGLVAVLHALQVFGQRLAARLARCRLGWCLGLGQAGLQGGQLRLQAGLVLGQRFLEQLTLLGRHGLGLGAELPALQARELEVDLLQLHIAPGDLAVLARELVILALQRLVLPLDVLDHLRSQRGDRLGRQTVKISGLELTHVEHALHHADLRRTAPLADVLSTVQSGIASRATAMLRPV